MLEIILLGLACLVTVSIIGYWIWRKWKDNKIMAEYYGMIGRFIDREARTGK